MSKGLKALKEVGKILGDMSVDTNGMPKFVLEGNRAKLYKIIEKELKALDIINNKEVNMIRFRAVEMLNGNADEYNKSEDYSSRHLTQEEFDLLKEVLKNGD